MHAVTLKSRLILLAFLFTAELIPLTIWLDGDLMATKGGLLALLGSSGSWILRLVVAFAGLLATFTLLHERDQNATLAAEVASVPAFNPRLLAIHFATAAFFTAEAYQLYSGNLSPISANALTILWIITGLTAITTAACAFIPLGFWHRIARSVRAFWVYALAAAAFACLIGAFAHDLWNSTALWTFVIVKAILSVILPGVFANPATMSIGTSSFHVEIAPQCSGLEGAALILTFTSLWLWLFRREFRFPRALLLLPASVAVLFLFNALRIATLILIGNAGAPDIALGGFHSQAGWIAFNVVAIGLMAGSRRVAWITTGYPAAELTPVVEENPAAPYLLPFLLTLAAAMVSAAASSGFEWLYPLRPLAAGAALWIFRESYRRLDWRFGWESPAIGALVFAFWLGGDWLNGVHQPYPLPPAANTATAIAQNLWLAVRLLAATVTVPIAEELAFRGYLIRRIAAADFESLRPTDFTAASLLLSSLAFGILHGNRWIAGTLAGLLYALVYLRRGRIGDAVVAHATTNGLLAASVLVTGQWNLS